MDVKSPYKTCIKDVDGVKYLEFSDQLSEHGYESLDEPGFVAPPRSRKHHHSKPYRNSSLSTSPTNSTDNLNSEPLESTPPSTAKECNSSQHNGMTDDQNNNRVNRDSSIATASASKHNESGCCYKNNPACRNTEDLRSHGEAKNRQNVTDNKLASQQSQSCNRFRFVPKNRQGNINGDRQLKQNNHRYNNRGSRRSTRSESDCSSNFDNKTRFTSMRNRNNEDIVFIIKRVDRSLRRTVSESSGETLPVRGILKYPRDWDRRTLSESSCDNSNQSNLFEAHEKGRTQSLDSISPVEASCEASTESACSSAVDSLKYEEEKPKKSVHFNCYVSAATFNINSIILNNKHSGSNKKKNKRRENNNKVVANVNSSNKKTNNTSGPKQPHHNNQMKHQQSYDHNEPYQKTNQAHQERINNQTKRNTKSFKGPVDDKNNESTAISPSECFDADEQSENVDPTETKMRSRQDSGYDSETSDRKGHDVDGFTLVKSPKRKFTVKKVDLNQ